MSFFKGFHRCGMGIVLCLAASSSAIAAPSINDMQGCQGMLDFVDLKVQAAESKYDADGLASIRKGLSAYNVYIQNNIITPGLLSYNGGDKAKTQAMQQQVDAYKVSLVEKLNSRYPQKKLVTDYAIAINECAKKAVPQGADLESLKTSLQLIIEYSKS